MGHFRSFASGIGFFFQGLRWVARNPRWWLFGLIPALVVFILYVAGLSWFGVNADDFARWATPFADEWGQAARTAVRVTVGLVAFGVAAVLFVLTFTAVTLIVGEPFYEKLSERVELTYGDLPSGHEVPLWKSIPRSIRDSLVTLGYVLLFTVPLFFLGFVPVIGQTVVPVLGALVSGFFLTVELTALAMERRGMARKSRFAVLRGNTALALGFGVLIFLIFLIPLASVVAMPAAVAGAAIMVRTRLAAPEPLPGLPGGHPGLPGGGHSGLPAGGHPGFPGGGRPPGEGQGSQRPV
ncbi:EI24 domain-containing protein [Streptosporangium sp. NPDC051022]|uniref:EI24 domain-containing protein n=1 Tax=Streptosporangium sp. NPDC051022 TaxID=3155752 RepID=UPI0034427D76